MKPYKYWIVTFDNEECLFPIKQFPTIENLKSYLIKNDIYFDEISQFDNDYEISETCLQYGCNNEYRFKCPYCGYEHQIDSICYSYEYEHTKTSFEYFNKYFQHCNNKECEKVFLLKNMYGGFSNEV